MLAKSYLQCCLCLQGCGPTVTRAVVVNAAQLATYSQAKQNLLATGMSSNAHAVTATAVELIFMTIMMMSLYRVQGVCLGGLLNKA